MFDVWTGLTSVVCSNINPIQNYSGIALQMLSTSTNGTHVLFSNVGSEKFHFLFALSFTHEKLCISDRLVCVPMGHTGAVRAPLAMQMYSIQVYTSPHTSLPFQLSVYYGRSAYLTASDAVCALTTRWARSIGISIPRWLMIVMMVSWCKPHALWE